MIERTRDQDRSHERWHGCSSLSSLSGFFFSMTDGLYPFPQIAITAGHEFLLSTDQKYAEICDDKIMYLDYVSAPSSGSNHVQETDGMLTFLLLGFGRRLTSPKLPPLVNSSTSTTVSQALSIYRTLVLPGSNRVCVYRYPLPPCSVDRRTECQGSGSQQRNPQLPQGCQSSQDRCRPSRSF